MLIPSQIRRSEPLKLNQTDDGVVRLVNAYEGEFHEFFPGRRTPLKAPDAPPALGRNVSTDTNAGGVEPAMTLPPRVNALSEERSEEELRERIERYLYQELDPDKKAEPEDVEAVYEWLKRTGSQCVSQIAIGTGLPRRRIFLALRHLLGDELVEWRPDTSTGCVNILETAWAIRRLIDKSKAVRVGRPAA